MVSSLSSKLHASEFWQVRASHHLSPLRYPGGKAKLAPYFKALVRHNKLLDCAYVEPFAGGGGVGLALLLHGYVDRIVLNDLSKPVYAFWRAILDKPDQFESRILEVELTIDEWIRQRTIFKESSSEVTFELGFAAFFLNRTNHSGVLNGGLIGGRSQRSAYGISARFNREELAARVRRIARNRSKIVACNSDAKDLILSIGEVVGCTSIFMYIDPPYYRKGRELYYDYYKSEDHRALRDSISDLSSNIRWVVSYDNEPEIVDLYRRYKNLDYNLSYSVRNGRKGRELLFFSNSLSPIDPIEASVACA